MFFSSKYDVINNFLLFCINSHINAESCYALNRKWLNYLQYDGIFLQNCKKKYSLVFILYKLFTSGMIFLRFTGLKIIWRTSLMTNITPLSLLRSTSPPSPFSCVILKQTAMTTRRNKRQVRPVVRERERYKNGTTLPSWDNWIKTLLLTNISASSSVDPLTRHCRNKTGNAALESHSPLVPICGLDTPGWFR